MSEGICTWGSDVKNRGYPNQEIFNLYERWSRGGFSMSITGNVMVNPYCLEIPGNAVICQENWSEELGKLLRKWADVSKIDGCLGIVQLGHCGRQTAVDSSTEFHYDPINEFKFYEYVQISLEDIQHEIIDRFVFATLKVKEAGFDGIQFNSAYGFLLSQFTSAKHNKRTDKYGGQSVESRVKIIVDIVNAIREYIPKDDKFIIGAKINPTEYFFESENGLQDAVEISKYFEDLFDFVEYCGGVAEPLNIPIETLPPAFAKRLKFYVDLQDLLRSVYKECKFFATGYRSVEGMVNSIKSGRVDGCLIARAATSEPDLPLKIMKNEVTGVHWNKFSPLDFHIQVEASGTQLLHISKTPLKNGTSLTYGIPEFTNEEACKKYVEQHEKFESTRKNRDCPVPNYMEFVE
ncbi:hypothetical protein WR25_11789 [Diploscapter pachys]|uniref:NADH:flavin oxidoreductase/NADH oxidase N-terminal domain-containing protein n=1 Tax=Diploscapter pachys TaxID=2018661 RepID=A0A2A2J976_9BILA|nr:hypothetical protein WR25_11789 [Diploscapter pachys]